jgi:membrane associated rhomboid family serine protease
MTFLILLIVLAGVVLSAMSAEERVRLARNALAAVREARDVIAERRRQPEPFRDALRARTRWAIVTPVLVALNLAIFVRMIFDSGALADPGTLVVWGGNIGPRTTNGEWWRLVTSLFVHTGFLQLIANILGLLQLGLLLERLVGRVALAVVYVSAGVFASLASLSELPVDVTVGASGAIFGMYGLLLASAIWSLFHRSALTIPLRAVRRLIPAAAVFLLYNGLHSRPDHAGFLVGFACGLVLARGISDRKPAARRVAVAMGATAMIAIAAAVPLRGVTDARPEMARVISVEDRTASGYETARDRFTQGRITAEKLSELIDRTIVPELKETRARLKALSGVPAVHRPMVAQAEEYLRLRDESWRLRADGLRKANLLTLRKADDNERAALRIIKTLRAADLQSP